MKKIVLKLALYLITFMAFYGANSFSVVGMYQPTEPEKFKGKI